MQLRRSQLFVPGNDERKIKKALGLLSVDSIIFDLEDAVPSTEKENARLLIKRALSQLEAEEGERKKGREFCVRINPVTSAHSKLDVISFKNYDLVSTIVVPKSEQASIEQLHSELAEKKLIPLVETAMGFLQLEKIVRCEGVTAVSFGAADFANSVSGTVEAYSQNIYIKTQIALTARAYGIEPIDCVFFGVADIEGFRHEAQSARALGFGGKQVIHPSQVEVSNAVFSPSEEELTRARRVIQFYEEAEVNKTGAIRMEDQLIDAVHYREAKQILQRKAWIDETPMS